MKTKTESTATTAPASTYDAPQAIERPTNAALPVKAAPHPLALELEGVQTTAAALARELEAQRTRQAQIDALTMEKAALLESIDNESVPYLEGSAKLATIDQNIGVLEWTTGRKGTAAVAEFEHQRQTVLDIKNRILETVNLATRATVERRQAEISATLVGWGQASAPTAPVALLTILEACPVCVALEGHRAALQATLPDDGLAAFLTVARSAVDALDGITLPEARETAPGSGRTEWVRRTLVAGWDGVSDRLDHVATFATAPEAADWYNGIRARTGFGGLVKIVLFDECGPINELAFPQIGHGAADHHQLREADRIHPRDAGTTPSFIADATRWLAV